MTYFHVYKPIFMMFDRYMFQRNWGLVVHFLKNIFDDKILVNLMIFAWSMIYYREKKLSPFCPCHSILRIDPGVFLFFQSFLYIAWYFIFSAMGNFNYFFFAAHLLDVAIGFKTLRTILQSVTHNGKQVLKVLEIKKAF